LFLVLLPVKTEAKDYSIEKVGFTVQLNEDGSADITEARTYKFDGSFTWADERIDLTGKCEGQQTCSDYVISNVAVTGADNITTSTGPHELNVKWYYRAVDETKNFVLKYRVENAVTGHPDISEFYWKLIGDGWVKGSGLVTATIYLPSPAPDDRIWGFGHGPLNGKVNIPDNRTVTFTAENLPPKQMFEVRVLYPKSGISGARESTQTLAQILDEEKKWGQETRKKVWFYNLWVLAAGLIAFGISVRAMWRTIYWVRMWRKYGDDAPLPEINLAGTLHEPPSELPPVAVETLMNMGTTATGKSITATLLDLMHKKTITLIPPEGKTFWGTGKKDFSLKLERGKVKNLNEPEEKLINFLFANMDIVSRNDIKNRGKVAPSTTRSFWEDWKKLGKKILMFSGILDTHANMLKQKMGRDILVHAVLIMFGLSFVKNLREVVPVPGMIVAIAIGITATATVVMVFTAVFMEKLTEKGLRETASWKAFKKYLQDYQVTRNNPIDSVVLWEKYLVYGTALGISLKALSQLPVNFDANSMATSGLYVATTGGGASIGNFSDTFAVTFGSLIAISNSFSGYGAAGTGGSGGFSGGAG